MKADWLTFGGGPTGSCEAAVEASDEDCCVWEAAAAAVVAAAGGLESEPLDGCG